MDHLLTINIKLTANNFHFTYKREVIQKINAKFWKIYITILDKNIKINYKKEKAKWIDISDSSKSERS